jgi:hypothetical protein
MKFRILSLVLLLSCFAFAQSVTLAPAPQFTSFLQNGQPNSFGCVFTFASGTSTPLSTNTDYISGTLNSNPVLLTAGGTAGIWFQTGLLYRVVVTTTDNAACSKPLGSGGATIYTVDGVNSSLLNTANTWDASQTFTATTYFTMSDLQLVFGTSGSQTTLDIPPTAGNYILHGPPIVGNDTLLNKNSPAITTPVINGCGITNSPGTYICIPNNSSTATVLNSLAILTGAPSTATVVPIAGTGAVGIVTAGAGVTGSATIQQSGTAPCIFDGATIAGDSVVVSSSVAGECHDSGSAGSPSAIGTVLSSNGGGGTYNIVLTPSVRGIVCSSATNSTVTGNTTAPQVISTCAFPAGALNSVGKMFRVTANLGINPIGSYTTSGLMGVGTTSSLGTNQTFVANTATADPTNADIQMTCGVTTSGATGALTCAEVITAVSAAGTITITPTGNTTPSFTNVNLTGVVYVGVLCSFGTGSSSNNCTVNPFVVEQLN